MNQKEKAKRFAQLHVKGAPLLLYNAWDAGSAQSGLEAGAKAIATSSWSVAAAQGYQDGEAIPIEFAEQIVGRIATSVDAPVTVDFEGGYSEDDSELADNISRLIDLGVIGVNFEDRVVKGSGLYSVDRQARRLGAIRKAAASIIVCCRSGKDFLGLLLKRSHRADVGDWTIADAGDAELGETFIRGQAVHNHNIHR